MSSSPTAATRVACIIGWPATYSLSPVIHNAAFAATGLDWVYVALPLATEGLAAGVEGLRALGIAGANVTIPHKQAVVPYLDALEPAAARFGAVNTIVNDGGRLVGDNTDGEGFLRFAVRDAKIDPSDSRVLVLGAGGAARAVGGALVAAGATVRIAARRAEQAAEAAAAAGAATVARSEIVDAGRDSTLIVNATPAGSDGSSMPIDAEALHSTCVVIDLIYARSTPLMKEAAARGATVHNGLGMLVQQAALSFERWTGVPAPLEAMRSAADAATLSL